MCTDHGHAHVPIVPVGPEREAWTGEPVPLEPVRSLTIQTICDNQIDLLLVDQGPAKRFGLGTEPAAFLEAPTLLESKIVDLPLAQHGFSALVTIEKDDHTHRFLFDTGTTPDGCVENLRRLDLDPGDIEVIVCSHGHFDHCTGLSGLAGAVGRTNLPVLIHPEFWSQRRINIPGRDPISLPTTSRRGLEDAGFEIVEQRWPSFLFERSVLVTGEVDRTTGFETGFAIHEAQREHGWEPDPLILDDQAMIVHLEGKGLVVLTGCGHAGVINILRYARRLTGIDDIHLVMGGFHLAGPLFEPVIPPTVSAMAEIDPDVIVPAHCTGWRAQQAFADALPERFLANSVGTSFVLA